MDITDAQWAVLEPLFRPKRRADGRGRPWQDTRAVLNGVFWVLRTGAPWHDLPSRYPPYQTCHRRFQSWQRSGLLIRLLQKLAEDLRDRGKLVLAVRDAYAALKFGAERKTMSEHPSLSIPSVTILRDKELSNSAYSHVINAPVGKIDIADWLFKLPEAEYKRCCPPDHISCGTTSTDEGTPMSINVERIGSTLMIQHYVAEVATGTLCRWSQSPTRLHPMATPACRSSDSKCEASRRAILRIHKQCGCPSHGGIHGVHR